MFFKAQKTNQQDKKKLEHYTYFERFSVEIKLQSAELLIQETQPAKVTSCPVFSHVDCGV